MSELPRLDRTVSRVSSELLELPEKAVQFGTGGFLRGFIEFFIDEANRQGRFGGRIVAIGSTGSGRDRRLNEQDGLYTLAVRGFDAGVRRSEYRVISSLSRALSAATEWDQVLECARNPRLEFVFSNTTEAGIVLDQSDMSDAAAQSSAPKSFPGKLTRFLYERARHFDYARASTLVVVPCELIENNGDRLKQIVVELATRWPLDARFMTWLDQVTFCNTLVDRIVPGEPIEDEMRRAWQELGYRDTLLTVCEPYRLFAIEADEATTKKLSFAAADSNIIVARDITQYRERKVRLLNGTHTIMVPLALLSGCTSVAAAVAHEQIGAYLRRVLFTELVPSMDAHGAEQFAHQVLDRFANPFIRHELADITLQQTMKLRVRIIPSILAFSERMHRVPVAIALGFAAFLHHITTVEQVRVDDNAQRVRGHAAATVAAFVRGVCADVELWGADLTAIPGFCEEVSENLEVMARDGVGVALDALLSADQAA